MQTKKRLVGAHVSSAGGHDKAVERAAAIGCNCVQVFSGSPRGWQRPDIAAIDTDKITAKQKELSVSPIFTHALYLINVTADKPEIVAKSVSTLQKELEFDGHIGGAGVVVHLGSHLGNGWDAVKDDLVTRLKQILKASPTTSTLLIENSAGQQGKLSSDLAEIRWVFDQLEKSGGFVSAGRLGWCFDTCHAWAAGYYFGETAPDVTAEAKNPVRGRADQVISDLNLWPMLKLIHINDSRDPFGSGRDRHENLGEGSIPLADLRRFLNLEPVKNIPLVTEVPGFAGEGPDAKNIEKIWSMLD